MKKVVLLASLSALLLLAVIGTQMIVTVVAQRTVGVSVGDWAEYACVYLGNATGFPPPDDEKVEWMKITVLEIVDTNITFRQRGHFADGHEETDTGFVDVDTGEGMGSGVFIAANLNEGDLVYTDPPPGFFTDLTINETISREYLGEIVEINHLNLTTTVTIPGVENQTMSYNYYWYRATGMLVEIVYYKETQPEIGDMTWGKIEVAIVAVIPEFSTWTSILLVLVVCTVAMVIYKRKILKKPIR